MGVNMSDKDNRFMYRAIELALLAEREGNLPVGAIVTLDDEIISEGKNAIWFPEFNANRHAEIEALRGVPTDLWNRSTHMTLYTTLEPCLMCLGAILLHRIGRVVFGSADYYGGSSSILNHLPPYFEERAAELHWIGPVSSNECDPLFVRLMRLVEARGEKK
jgi:tRNA(adenine34) deaminase